MISLSSETASRFARLALGCIAREYPNKLDHVMLSGEDVHPPRALHPAFYGCFDWHSAVHSHWMLVRLLRTVPNLAEAGHIRDALSRNLASERIAGEIGYADQPERKSFERTYGWAWLLKLAQELHVWEDPDGRTWSRNLEGLAQVIVDRYLSYFPTVRYPIRRGVHPNTAFGLAFALDYAREVGVPALEEMAVTCSLAYFDSDTDSPAGWEPDGDDFFSPALMEADLMRRVKSAGEFGPWLERFLPGLARGVPRSLLEPVTVDDREDPKGVHLDGLNLSRAWCMTGIAKALPAGDAAGAVLAASAERHAEAGLEHVESGQYAGEHWLATFAVYLLTMSEES